MAEQLMEFVFGNLVFIVIVIGVITSLLSRLRGGDTAGKRPSGMPPFGGEGPFGAPDLPRRTPARPAAAPRRMPDAGPVRTDGEAPGMPAYPPMVERPSPATFKPEPADTPAVRPVPAASMAGSASDRGPRSEVRSAEVVRKTVSPQSVRSPAAAKTASPRETAALQVERDPLRQALEGMIWSEILGAPRALRPHASVRMRRGR